MNMFASQTMSSSIKYILCLSMLIIKLSLIHGYDSRSNFRMIDVMKSQLESVIKDLKYVKEDLREEKEKSVILEKELNTLKDESKGTFFNNKDSKKEVDTAQNYPEQRVYNALHDEKQERKVFENLVKSFLKDEKVNMEIKISILNKTLTAHIDTKLNTLQDKVLHSVTELNDSIASIKELTSNVKQNENSITYVKLESEQQNTTLLIHDAMLVTLNESLLDVEASLMELSDNCYDKGWNRWSKWSSCSKSCGVGLQTSTRTCGSTNTLLSGKCCIGSDTKIQVCTLPSCLEWSGWASWSTCSSSCGIGQQKSTRTCSTNTPLSGNSCEGSDTKTKACTLTSCPVWSGWSSWSSCSSSCGVGQQKSTRTCTATGTTLSSDNCIGSDTQTQACTLPSCTVAKDCLEVLNQNKSNVNGVYKVRSPSSGLVYPVYCDMTTDGGGWTVFQKRFDGSLDFYLTFTEYEDGFGDVNAEFWMGLKHVHDMTAHNETELRIDLTAADGSTAYASFQNFSLSPGPDYKLHIGQAAGTAGRDSRGLTYNNGYSFSTKDKDVDPYSRTDCAEYAHGAWWFGYCSHAHLNGDYGTPGTKSAYAGGQGGVVYYGFKEFQSLKSTTMMIRRK